MFSTVDVNNFEYVCSGFVFCVCSDQSEFMAFLVFNFSVVIFLLLPLDYIHCRVHILTRLLFLWCPVPENSLISGVHQVKCFFVWSQKQSRPPKCCAYLKKLDGQSPK